MCRLDYLNKAEAEEERKGKRGGGGGGGGGRWGVARKVRNTSESGCQESAHGEAVKEKEAKDIGRATVTCVHLRSLQCKYACACVCECECVSV